MVPMHPQPMGYQNQMLAQPQPMYQMSPMIQPMHNVAHRLMTMSKLDPQV